MPRKARSSVAKQVYTDPDPENEPVVADGNCDRLENAVAKSAPTRRGRKTKKPETQDIQAVTSKLRELDVKDIHAMEVEESRRVKSKRRIENIETKSEVDAKTKKLTGRHKSGLIHHDGNSETEMDCLVIPKDCVKPKIVVSAVEDEKISLSAANKENLSARPTIPKSAKALKMLNIAPEARTVPHPKRTFVHVSNEKVDASIKQLKSVFDSICRDPPTPLYRRVCLSLALSLLQRGHSVWDIAYYMVESQAVTFRHKALVTWGSRIRKLEKDASKEGNDLREYFSKLRQALFFNKTPRHLREIVQTFPSDWTICQLSVTQTPGRKHRHLLVYRIRPQEEPLVLRMDGFSDVDTTEELLLRYKTIFERNAETLRLTDRAQWWKDRFAMDEDIKTILEKMEHNWLGCWKGILYGQIEDQETKENLAAAVRKLLLLWKGTPLVPDVQAKVEVLLLGYRYLTQRHCVQAFLELCTEPNPSPEYITSRLVSLRDVASSLSLESPRHGPVIFILDKDIQHLPWENFPCMHSQKVSRMPSVYLIAAQYTNLKANLKSVFNQGVNQEKSFYVIDPDANLPSTSERFQDWFEREGWDGLAQKKPTSDEFKRGISEHDLFIYCGHGSGTKYLSKENLEMANCNAAVFLMGCSSGKLVTAGQLEPRGVMMHYFLAGGPSMLGCLWDVTDRDIDRYTESMLKSLLSTRGEPLADSVVSARDSCRLRYVTAAAPVVYGLPVHTNL